MLYDIDLSPFKWRYLKIVVIICLSFSITACLNEHTYFRQPTYLSKTQRLALVGAASGAAVGAYTGGGFGAGIGVIAGGIIGTTVGHFLQRHQTTLEKLMSNGVQVIAVGDNVVLILPANKFFYENSPNRRREMDPLLNDIAALLRGYRKVEVKVAAFTAPSPSAQRALALTTQQAQAIVDYLWAQGTDTRMMYAVGYGDAHPIASNQTAYGRAKNRRIEISLRLLPSCCQLAMPAS
ncbi:MAG: OmpA family protein [Legionellales bacterium]|nr:OmpA family protein [Legionellales bacterium]